MLTSITLPSKSNLINSGRCYILVLDHSTRLQNILYCLPNYMNTNLSLKRIQKQTHNISIDPIPNAIVTRDGTHNFHFCLYGLEEPYTQGFYHGLLELSNDYPFSPPKIMIITNNGRFESNKSICTTFTHFHKQTWSASWNIRSMITAFISFMHQEEKGLGGLIGNKVEMAPKRKLLAERSLKQNLKNEKFVELFKNKLIQLKLVTEEKINQLKTITRQKQSKKRRLERLQLTKTQQDNMQMEQPNAIEQKQINQIVQEQETGQRKRQMFRDQEQINQYQIMIKKRKIEEELPYEHTVLERQKTVQETDSP